jgi:hypothetical protein
MKVLTQEETVDKLVSTALGGYAAATYNELLQLFGKPTYGPDDQLDKSNFEWIIEYSGKIFSIYDWKCTKDYSMHERNLWHVGSEWRDGGVNMISAFNAELNKKLAEIREKNHQLLRNIYVVTIPK